MNQKLAFSLIQERLGENQEARKKYALEILAMVLMIVLQYLYQKFAFYCPHDASHFRYSMYSMFGPPILFYCLAILNNESLQYNIQGVARGCFTKKNSRNQKMLRLNWQSVYGDIVKAYIRCLLAPITWIVISLIRKKFYVCAKVGYVNNDLVGRLNATRYKAVTTAGTESQTIGFSCVVLPVLFFTILMTFKKCFKNPIDDLPSLETFTTYEAEVARHYFKQIIQNAAQKFGKKKVQLIMESTNAGRLTHSSDDVTLMTYVNAMAARERMMDVYPVLENRTNLPLQRSMAAAWQDEIEIFQDILKPQDQRRRIFSEVVENCSINETCFDSRVESKGEKTPLL